MHIVFQYYTGGGGGLANFLQLLRAIRQHHADVRISIVCSDETMFLELKDVEGFRIHPLPGGRFKEFYRLLIGFGGLALLAKRFNADVLWSLNLGSYIRGATPQVLSLNNAHQIYPLAEIRGLHPGGGIRLRLLRFFFRLSVRAANGVILQTELMKRYLHENLSSTVATAVIPKAVEKMAEVESRPLTAQLDELFHPSSLSKPRGAVGLYVASAYPHKNHLTLISAFCELKKRKIDIRLALTLTEEEIIKIGGSDAQDLLSSGYILAIGWIAKPYLKSLYLQSDFCLMPSVLESLSSSHLEAMEWRRPQIVSDLPFSRDLCGDAALYVSPYSVLDWVDAIITVCSDSSIKERLINLGAHRMQSFPSSWEECANQTYEFLKSVVTNRPSH